MEKELQNLFSHTIESIQKNELDKLEENIEVFRLIYEQILKNSKNPDKSNIQKEWSRYINKIGEKLLDVDLLDKTRDMINSIFEISNKYKKHNLNLDSILFKFLRIIKEMDNPNKIKDLSFLSILLNMLKNAENYNGYYQDNDVPGYYARYYYSIFNNRHLTAEEKEEIIRSIINECIFLPFYSEIKQDECKVKVVEKIVLYLLKAMIDQGDISRISFFAKKLKGKPYSSKELDLKKLFLTTSIYLYYLGLKENFSSEKKQEYKNLLLGLGLNLDSLMDYEVENSWIYYREIKNELSKWEQFVDEDNGKWLMMNSVVREFFLFLTATQVAYNIKSFDEYVSNEEELFTMLSSLLNDNNIKEGMLESYHNFKSVFGYSSQEDRNMHELSLLKEHLLARYKNIHINKVRGYSRKTELVLNNSQYLGKVLKGKAEDVSFLRSLNREINVDLKKITIFKDTYPTFYFLEGEQQMKLFENVFVRHLTNFLLHNFQTSAFLKDDIRFRSTKKIEKFFNLVKEVEKNSDFSINSLIDGLTSNSGFFYTEEEEKVILFNNYLERLESLEKAKESLIVGLDKRFNGGKIGDINVQIRNLRNGEVEKLLTTFITNDSQYKINIVNDISVFFEKEEAIEYISLGYKVIEIELEIGLQLTEGSGFILKLSV
ncbi:hypothetical protein COC52_24890 [Priestia megaterium]|uniref:hypothetical protein n=1 Tax=Priestia megaterium TaxID=1404 RepID=UPI000BFEA8A0|nr:hypothetical protein [Priestia megaterium]PGR23033.1 hypothetical protein COC52_24890 [Priestia megaterium]